MRRADHFVLISGLFLLLAAPARAQDSPAREAAIYGILYERAWDSMSKKDYETAVKRFRLALNKLAKPDVSALLDRHSERDCQWYMAVCLARLGKGHEAFVAIERANDVGRLDAKKVAEDP